MTDQNAFMELIRDVADIMRTSEGTMSEEEILAYFKDMELDDQQKKLILEYLANPENISSGNTDDTENAEGTDGETGNDDASEDSKVLAAYMEDLSLLETYNEDEVMALYGRLFSGESEVIETLSTVWLKKVLEIAKNYVDLHAKLEDLIQEGNIALLMRLNQLCGTPDCSDVHRSFSEIEEDLSKAVESGIADYITEWNGAKEQESALVGKLSLISEAAKLLEMENGATPTVEELAEYTKMSKEELSVMLDMVKNPNDSRKGM